MQPSLPDISIVLPVWNESSKIAADVDAATRFIEAGNFRGELIVSDDGSVDDTIRAAALAAEGKNCPVKIIRNDHQGKGHAVKAGILAATGNIILFIDSGNCIPYKDVLTGIEMISRSECDIAHGSRYLPDSRIVVHKGLFRRMMSFLFRKFIHLYLKIPNRLTDTQCGLKIYRGEIARQLYSECFIRGFMFDVEIILRAGKKKFRIREFPVRWHADPDSRLSVIRSLPGTLKALVILKRNFK